MLRVARQECGEQGEGGASMCLCGGVRQPFVFVSAAAVGRYSTLGEEPGCFAGAAQESFLDVCGVLGLLQFSTL